MYEKHKSIRICLVLLPFYFAKFTSGQKFRFSFLYSPMKATTTIITITIITTEAKRNKSNNLNLNIIKYYIEKYQTDWDREREGKRDTKKDRQMKERDNNRVTVY